MDLLPQVFAELKDGRIPRMELLTLVATRFVGYAMTLCACFVKLPQIMKIYKQQSAQGISVASFELEVLICIIHNSYCYMTHVPFSSYGEAVAALVQNSILLILLYHHSQTSLLRRLSLTAFFSTLAALVLTERLNMEIISFAFLMNQVMFVFGRGLQIFKTAREKNVKQLSISTYGTVVLGKSIRILTLLREGAALPLQFANLIGFTVNGIMVLQILYYNRKTTKEQKTE